MNFRTELTPSTLDFKIDYNRQGLMLGSCFVENIGAKMSEIKLPVSINPLGIIYNPASIASTIERIASGKLIEPEELFFDGLLFRHYDLHSRFCATSASKALEQMNAAIESAHTALTSSSYIILTLGTARTYTLNSTKKIVCNCHKTPQKEFTSSVMSVAQVVETLGKVISKCLKDKQVILTVSPIRHLKDGFEQNNRSKAILTLACHELSCTNPNIHYFPAYEIMMDDLRDYRFYASDLVHPSPMAVDYIWDKFSRAAFAESTFDVAARVIKITQALAHRPFNPESDAHKAFIERTRKDAAQLTQEFANIKF